MSHWAERLRPRGALWHNSDFRRLWAAQTVSQFGSEITGLALPLLAILVLHASTFEVAALAVVDWLPSSSSACPPASGSIGCRDGRS